MELFAPPRPDHAPPETLDDASLAVAIDSLRRKLRSVRASSFAARLGGLALLLVIMAGGFTLAWVGPEPFLPRIYQHGTVVTVPELLTWWTLVIAALLFAGLVGVRLFAHRLDRMRGWTNRVHELQRRLEHAESEQRRRA